MNTNKFCKECGIICLRNGDKCNYSKKIGKEYFCETCAIKLKKISAEDRYYAENTLKRRTRK